LNLVLRADASGLCPFCTVEDFLLSLNALFRNIEKGNFTLKMASDESASQPSLFFQSHNERGAETILLIHGACGSSHEWNEVILHLTVKDYHVLVPDLPMHG